LYWNHYNGYYIGTGFSNLAAARLDTNTGNITTYGPWHLPNAVMGWWKSYWAGVTRLPQWFADRYTGGRSWALGFGGYYSICAPTSRGPALGAMFKPDTLTDTLDLLPMLHYTGSDKALRDGDYIPANVGFWNDLPSAPWAGYYTYGDISRAGAFIDLPNKKGLVMFNSLATGRVSYDYGGWNTAVLYDYWYFYDIRDIGSAARGDTGHGVQPVSCQRLRVPDSIGIPYGAYYDPSDSLLYVYVNRVNQDLAPLVHVFAVTDTGGTAIEASAAALAEQGTVVAHPNPCNPSTVIDYTLLSRDAGARFELAVYDISGKLVRTLVRGKTLPGAHACTWNGHDNAGREVSAGMYIVRLKTGALSRNVKVLLAK
jgi:hypothetical protein